MDYIATDLLLVLANYRVLEHGALKEELLFLFGHLLLGRLF